MCVMRYFSILAKNWIGSNLDITTTGATLKDNGLKVLDDGVILKSQAQLAASLSADWNNEARAACQRLLAKLDPASPLYAGLAAALPA